MSRWLAPALVCLLSAGFAAPAQQKPEPQSQEKEQAPKEQAPKEEAPPEEDEALKPKEYSFNPLQAEKEVRIGNYYFRKGSYKAATQRFREATKWNANLPEAYVRLGEAEEKQRDAKAAREAYEKFLQLAPDDKRSPEVRKKLAKLPKAKN